MVAAQAAKIMEINEAWSHIYDEGYIHQFQPKSTQKNSAAAEAPHLKISSHGASPV